MPEAYIVLFFLFCFFFFLGGGARRGEVRAGADGDVVIVAVTPGAAAGQKSGRWRRIGCWDLGNIGLEGWNRYCCCFGEASQRKLKTHRGSRSETRHNIAF